MVLVKQTHGMAVHVPSGWGHSVKNLEPNVKLCWDFTDPLHLPLYHLAEKKVGCKVSSDQAAMDYSDVFSSALEIAMLSVAGAVPCGLEAGPQPVVRAPG